MLAEALCKLEGFVYAPSETIYWQHGHSTERDFVYVTAQNLSPDQLQQLSDEVGSDRTLLVLCTAFRGKAERWANLTVKKIPRAVLSRCECRRVSGLRPYYYGASEGTRTLDLRFTKPMLYQLSYAGFSSPISSD